MEVSRKPHLRLQALQLSKSLTILKLWRLHQDLIRNMNSVQSLKFRILKSLSQQHSRPTPFLDSLMKSTTVSLRGRIRNYLFPSTQASLTFTIESPSYPITLNLEWVPRKINNSEKTAHSLSLSWLKTWKELGMIWIFPILLYPPRTATKVRSICTKV